MAANAELARLRHGYLASPEDRRVMRDCVHMGREIAYQAALDPYRGAEYAPGRDIQSDDQIDAYIELKMAEVLRFEMTPHPVEFDMYYSV